MGEDTFIEAHILAGVKALASQAVTAGRTMAARLSLLAIEFLRTQKFSTSGSYFLCEVPPVRFYLLARCSNFIKYFSEADSQSLLRTVAIYLRRGWSICCQISLEILCGPA
jgi:hypothetical protein